MFLERTPDFLCRAWLVFGIGFRFWFKKPTPIPFEGVESFLVFCAWRVRLPGSATPRPEAFRRVWFSGASGLPACLCLRVCVCVCVSASAVPAVRVRGVAWRCLRCGGAWRGGVWGGGSGHRKPAFVGRVLGVGRACCVSRQGGRSLLRLWSCIMARAASVASMASAAAAIM